MAQKYSPRKDHGKSNETKKGIYFLQTSLLLLLLWANKYCKTWNIIKKNNINSFLIIAFVVLYNIRYDPIE